MDKFEVDLVALQNDKMRLDKLMNDYEECVELIGHLARVFNREGFWDFKDSLNGVYKKACKHENDLGSLIDCIKQVNDIYIYSQQQEPSNNLNIQYILGGMRVLTKDDSYKLIKSLSIRGDINIGIDIELLLESTTVSTYENKVGQVGFKLETSSGCDYTEMFKKFESQADEKWSSYGNDLKNKTNKSVYNSTISNNEIPAVISPIDKKDKRDNTNTEDDSSDDISHIMIEATIQSHKRYIEDTNTDIDEAYKVLIYTLEGGADSGHKKR